MKSPWVDFQSPRAWWAVGTVGLVVLWLAATVAAQEPTSENDDRVKQFFEKNPKADVNGDGVLTMSEARAFREKARPQRTGARAPRSRPPEPDLKDHHYGPHELQTFDLWRAESDRPTPLVAYIHGGGFRGGDKNSVSAALVSQCLDAGISVAAINYRLTPEVCFPATHLDAARAIQTLRHHAAKWNLDPRPFAATGGSAGAGISMWLAMKDDMADPDSDDPVARQSTRLVCAAVKGGQSSYDPFFAAEIGLPGLRRHEFFLPFYGITADEIDSPRARKLYEEAAAITYASADDVPILMDYNVPNEPVTEETPLGAIVHHPKFGIALKEKLDKLGVLCIVQYPDHPPRDQWISDFDFLAKHLGVKSDNGEKTRPLQRR